MGAAGWGWILAVLAWALAVLAKEPIAGIPPGEIAAALGAASLALMITGWAVERSRGGWRGVVGALAVWVLLVGGLGAAYLNRSDLLDAARAVGYDMGIASPEPVVGPGGELTVSRQWDGTYAVPAKLNDRDVTFLFDTGASSVVLSAETAQALGFKIENLNFRIPVSTANGRGLAAPVVIDRLAVGPIQFRRFPALVARPGMLDGNLLGQTFLDRLESYEVRGKRLVLRSAKS